KNDAGQASVADAEFAAYSIRRLGLGVKGLVLTWRAPAEDEDARIGQRLALSLPGFACSQQIRQRQPGRAQHTDAEHITAGWWRRKAGHGFFSVPAMNDGLPISIFGVDVMARLQTDFT